jgi:osmotically-inducible protein OsmY
MFNRNVWMQRPRRASLLLVAAMAVGTVAYAGSESDSATQAKVEAALKADHALLAKHIDVSVKDGTVRLAGFVQEKSDIERAKKDAEGVSGVKMVKNEMTLKRSDESNTSGP